VPREGFKFAEPDFVPPPGVKFWVQADRNDNLHGSMSLADKRGFRAIKQVNLIDDADVATPDGLAGYLVAGGGRMDILGTWG
jgi:hypothetical protein